MSLPYFDFFSFSNTLSFIFCSVNNTLLASVCSSLTSFFWLNHSFSPGFCIFLSVYFFHVFMQAFFLISPLVDVLSISSSLSKVSGFSLSVSTKVSPKLLYLFNNSFLIPFHCKILDLFVLFLFLKQ